MLQNAGLISTASRNFEREPLGHTDPRPCQSTALHYSVGGHRWARSNTSYPSRVPGAPQVRASCATLLFRFLVRKALMVKTGVRVPFIMNMVQFFSAILPQTHNTLRSLSLCSAADSVIQWCSARRWLVRRLSTQKRVIDRSLARSTPSRRRSRREKQQGVFMRSRIQIEETSTSGSIASDACRP